MLGELTYTHQNHLSLGISFERTVDSCTGIMVTVVYPPSMHDFYRDVLYIIAEYFNQVVQ